ncbi:hypothetical protein AQJ11_37750 [Streptomyces corchorusii]|uniref:Uncharacterized protein n=2 Tax=Streptomyces TaxID=1883 RepID=A0A101PTV2_STRCK|nr:hypothetical protein [Streptomyces corchorusii]KUN17610.1 hypothetical protein AQJ11_37750 [Streptomyces corchorusii]
MLINAAICSRRLPGRSWYAVLAVALLCYGTTRSEQLPRTYNPQRTAETAVKAYRLQRGMSEAAELVQHVLNDTVADPQWTAPPCRAPVAGASLPPLATVPRKTS